MPTPTRRPTRPKAQPAPSVPTALALCTGCHAYLAENLLGELRCPTSWCPQRVMVAGRVDVVLGSLAEGLAVSAS